MILRSKGFNRSKTLQMEKVQVHEKRITHLLAHLVLHWYLHPLLLPSLVQVLAVKSLQCFAAPLPHPLVLPFLLHGLPVTTHPAGKGHHPPLAVKQAV